MQEISTEAAGQPGFVGTRAALLLEQNTIVRNRSCSNQSCCCRSYIHIQDAFDLECRFEHANDFHADFARRDIVHLHTLGTAFHIHDRPVVVDNLDCSYHHDHIRRPDNICPHRSQSLLGMAIGWNGNSRFDRTGSTQVNGCHNFRLHDGIRHVRHKMRNNRRPKILERSNRLAMLR
jgi:hypothetical protein